MDEQNQPPQDQAQDLSQFGTPGRTGYTIGPHQNPYGVNQQPAQAPVQQSPQQQAGMFDSMPYHKWLATQKEPWNISDEDLKGKQFDAYVNGPAKTIIGAQLAKQYPHLSQANLDDRVDKEVKAMKLTKRGEVEDSLPDLKAHLAGLKPADVPGQVAPGSEDLGSNLMAGLEHGVKQIPGMLYTAAAGLPELAARLVDPFAESKQALIKKMTGKTIPTASDAFQANPLVQKFQDAAFKEADAASAKAGMVAQPGDSLGAKIAYGVGSLPTGLVTLGMDQPLEQARADLTAGKDLNEVKKNLAIDAAHNAILSKVPGGSLMARGLKGAALNPMLDTAARFTKGEKSPENVDLALDAIFGAGFAAVFGRKTAPKVPGANDAGNPGGGTPPPGAGGVDADAMAAAAQGGKGNLPPEALTPDIHSQIHDAETPADLQAVHDKNIQGVKPENRQEFTDRFNEAARSIHSDDPAFQVKPQAAQPSPVQGEANQAPTTPNGATNAPSVVPQPGTGQNQFQFAGAQPKVRPIEQPLPKSLEKSSPRFGSTKLDFDSDVEKALYIVGNRDVLSKADPRFLDYLRAHFPGVSDGGIKNLAAKVKEHVKSTARANPDSTTLSVPKLGVHDKFHTDKATAEAKAQEPPPQAQPEAARPVEAPVANPAEAVKAATEPQATPDVQAPEKGSIESMLSEPVKAPIIGARGRQVASTNLKFASETDKLGYLHANADPETQATIAEQLKARGVRDPAAFAEQVQAQVKANTRGNSLKSVPAETSIGVIVPHVMRGIPLPPKSKGGKTGPKVPPR